MQDVKNSFYYLINDDYVIGLNCNKQLPWSYCKLEQFKKYNLRDLSLFKCQGGWLVGGGSPLTLTSQQGGVGGHV